MYMFKANNKESRMTSFDIIPGDFTTQKNEVHAVFWESGHLYWRNL